MTDKSSESGENLPCCSFCGKNRDEVDKLIAGPSVYICNQCVHLCSDIVSGETSEPILITADLARQLRSAYEGDMSRDPNRIQ